MTPLTIHLLIQNNEETIAQTLESILPLEANIIIGDTGSRDNTVTICKNYGLTPAKVSNHNRSHARNEIVRSSQTDWQFYIEPWEILLSGQERLLELTRVNQPQSYYCELLQGDSITKQVRLWHKGSGLSFVNPIFETIKMDKSEYAEVVIYKEKSDVFNTDKIAKWKSASPLATDPYYFQAFACLGEKKYKEFLNNAEHFLFHDKKQTISATMTRYYIGIVKCFAMNDLEEAIKMACVCIAAHPLMAEFWCLLGDVYFQAKDFENSRAFYENALLLGQRRLRGDRWPMHISKYDEYPNEMIESCRQIISNVSKFYVNKQDQAH
jgi:glycosyltransferase involved in cell wall biosynthesis